MKDLNLGFVREAEERLRDLFSEESLFLIYLRIERDYKKGCDLGMHVGELFSYVFPNLVYCFRSRRSRLKFLKKWRKKEGIGFGEFFIDLNFESKFLLRTFIKSLDDDFNIKEDRKSFFEEKFIGKINEILSERFVHTLKVINLSVLKMFLLRVRSFSRLARLSASKVQIVGAEKSLFNSIRSGKNSPKYGILYNCFCFLEIVNRKEYHGFGRGKICKKIANKFVISFRQDYYGTPMRKFTSTEGKNEKINKL